MSALDWSTLCLDSGERVLIEASAGTGKTWTISAVYLRLLLEQKRTVGQIVVTTFTDAAAQELRERLRQRVSHAERLATDPRRVAADSDDSVDKWLLARWQTTDSRAHDRLRLRMKRWSASPAKPHG